MRKLFFKINYHYFFLLILSLNYIIPLILFNNVTLFYHDALDSELVYNYVIGKFILNGSQELDIFLNNEIKIEYLRRVFYPITLLYSILNVELAYWFTDILVKIISYFSFFIFAKNYFKEKIFFAYLLAALFATLNNPTLVGLGTAILPYIAYLICYKNNIKIKNYLIILFCGLNTDLNSILGPIFIVTLCCFIINSEPVKEKIKKIFYIFLVFLIASSIVNFNLISLFFSNEVLHRSEFVKDPFSFLVLLKNFFNNLFNLPAELNWNFFYKLPYFLFIPFMLLSYLIGEKNKDINRIFYLFIVTVLFITILSFKPVDDFKKIFLQSINLTYVKRILPFIYCLICMMVISLNNKKILTLLTVPIFISIFFSQINSSIVPFYKQFILQENNYKNIYTFDGYYDREQYKMIKKIVGDRRVISIGVDPMVAVMNDIKTIDGYHNIYPLNYKYTFFKIIEGELQKNEIKMNYFINFGSRLYSFVTDPKDIKINFNKAKQVGADFVISKFKIENNDLRNVPSTNLSQIYLYKIK